MQIGVLGAGNVGGALGTLWAVRGHTVTFGVRSPHSPRVQALLAQPGDLRAAGVAEAVAASQVVALAVPGASAVEVVGALPAWDGRVLIDTTNRFPLTPGLSQAQQIQAAAPSARVVKAFNTLGYNRFAAPQFDGQRASMFLCGDDAGARGITAGLIEELGFAAIDCGPLANAADLEALAHLWVWLARSGLGRDIAFKLLSEGA